MRLLFLKAALAAGCVVFGIMSSANADNGFSPREDLEALQGNYASTAPESWYGGFGTRQFSFDRGNWGLTFTHALDPDMKMKTFAFRTEGPYTVGDASKVVAGAYDAVFTENSKYVTLLTDDAKIVEAFGFSNCGLKYNVEVDISKTGCAAWKPVAACGKDHDLLALDAKGLYFGVRPADNDMCTPDKRPTALLVPVSKQ
jgi:hypothetical protein